MAKLKVGLIWPGLLETVVGLQEARSDRRLAVVVTAAFFRRSVDLFQVVAVLRPDADRRDMQRVADMVDHLGFDGIAPTFQQLQAGEFIPFDPQTVTSECGVLVELPADIHSVTRVRIVSFVVSADLDALSD